MKDSPSILKYVFLGKDPNQTVIVSKALSKVEKEKLMRGIWMECYLHYYKKYLSP